MNDHTPGPWYDVGPLYPDGAAHRVVTGGEQGLPHIAYVPKNAYAATEAEAHANARLIAAAPELLAAVEALFPADHWARYYGAPLTDVMTVELTCKREELLALKAAIAKAKGG